MRAQHDSRVFALFLVAAVVGTVVVGLEIRSSEAVPAGAAGTTLDNLQAAYDGERNARNRYFAFAKKAEEEGYGEVASLFRAAAAAEDIHASNHRAVIEELGGTPTSDVKEPDVKTTRENLETAVRGESYERDTLYPQFLEQARKEGSRGAVGTFGFAKNAEAEHARLCATALGAIEGLKGSKVKGIYVCTVCGYTTTQIEFEKCPSCAGSRDKYVKVS